MESAQTNTYMQIGKGLLISFVTTLIGILIFALILTLTNLSENTIPVVIIAISFVSILIGTTISTRKIHKNGMINGGIVGGIYVLLLYIISSLVNTGFTLNIYTIIMMIAGIIAGLIGGILGINSWNKWKTSNI